jgi:N-acetylmuramic acid 6-phosphate etherase
LKIRAETETRVFVHGGLFDHSRLFRLYFDQALEGAEPKLTPMVPEVRGHACVLGIALLKDPLPDWVSVWTMAEQQKMGVPATEATAEGSPLDALTPLEVVRRMNEHDHVAADAVAGAALQIAGVIEAAARAIGSGGRLIYVGAGTSGRLGVLDASECAPTFGLGQDRVMGLIAGGERALRESIEGAEDDISAGRMDIDGVRPPVGPRDVVIGVAASGRTPYTIAALREAKGNGARTAFVCCSPPLGAVADMLVQLQTGPEVLPGSTRLKAGTATKMVLNMISTGAMALSGYVYKGMMVGLRPVNAKLWDRAVRIVSILTGRGPGQAAKLLQDAEGRIQVAVIMAELGVEPAEAIRLLKLTRGNLREALGRR